MTKNAAVVAENTGIGTAWVGALMLLLATSLPELVTTLRAASIDAPDLAMGNVLGSCLYNLTLLAVIDLLEGRSALTARVSQDHIITASLSIITLCLASIAMIGVVVFPIGWIGLESLLIALTYIFGSRLVYRYEYKNALPAMTGDHLQDKKGQTSTSTVLLQFIVAAGFIVTAGVVITDAADHIAVATGLGHSFVGSIFLAISTGLPETVTTISAVRLGYLNMAVANVFGANFVNLFVIFVADLFYYQAPLFYRVSAIHMLSAVAIIMFSTVFVFGLTYRAQRKFARMGFDAWLIITGYLTVVYFIYTFGGN